MSAEESRLYETPDGVASRTSEGTIYANVDHSKDGDGLIFFSVNRRTSDDRRFVLHFKLDAEMARIFADRILMIARQADLKSK